MKSDSIKNIAVVLAGGSGTRLGDDIPKQFLKVAGKKIIEHTIDVFEDAPSIDEIVVVVKSDFLMDVEQIVNQNNYRKVKKILHGGKERYESSLAAIHAYEEEVNLLFHDAVRPLVDNRIIEDCIRALQTYDAVDVATPSTDTIVQVDSSNCIDHIPDRSLLRNGQTPQCFKRSVILQAYENALQDPNFKTTDDCGVVKKYLPNVPVFVVRGEVFNMKITYKEDLFLLDKLFQLKSYRSEHNELHPDSSKALKGKVIVVFGGSYGIGKEVVDMARACGAVVYAFSRSENSVNISDEKAVRTVLESVAKQNSHIDSVICTAGILVKEPLQSMDYADISESIDTNLKGVINVAKESYPYLKATKGSLLFYTSSSYTKGRMMYSIYSATKAAIVNFVQAISEEWHAANIRVNCINPERTKTPMRTKSFGNEPEGSLLDPKKVAIASLHVATSELTGQVIDVRR